MTLLDGKTVEEQWDSFESHEERHPYSHTTSYGRLHTTEQEKTTLDERESTHQGQEEKGSIQALSGNKRTGIHRVLQGKKSSEESH